MHIKLFYGVNAVTLGRVGKLPAVPRNFNRLCKHSGVKLVHTVAVLAVKVVAYRHLRLKAAQHFNLKCKRVVLGVALARYCFKRAVRRFGIIIREAAYNGVICNSHRPKPVKQLMAAARLVLMVGVIHNLHVAPA